MDNEDKIEVIKGNRNESPVLNTETYFDSTFDPPMLRLVDEFQLTETGWTLTRRWVSGMWNPTNEMFYNVK